MNFLSIELSSDTSSSSTDGRVQQLGNSIKSSPSPQKGSSLKMFNKHSKTPLHDHYYGSLPNAALVPQTDIQSRYQHRRRRNSSSSSSGVQRPGKLSIDISSFAFEKLDSSSSVWQTK